MNKSVEEKQCLSIRIVVVLYICPKEAELPSLSA